MRIRFKNLIYAMIALLILSGAVLLHPAGAVSATAAEAAITEPAPAAADEFSSGDELASVELDLDRYVIWLGGFEMNLEGNAQDAFLLGSAGSGDLAGLENAMGSAFGSLASEIDVSQYKVPYAEMTGQHVFEAYLNEHPEYFYVTSAKIQYNKITGIVTKLFINYDAGYTPQRSADVESRVQAVLSGMDGGWSDLQKCVYLHDSVVTACTYDYTYTKYGLDDVMLDGRAICSGYAAAYQYLLTRAGITCETVVSPGMDHAWNRVLLDGVWYYVDCTWDDADAAGQNPFCRLNVRYRNFLRSREGLTGTGHTSSDWSNTRRSIYGEASGTKYDSCPWIDKAASDGHVKMGIGSNVLLFADADNIHVDILRCHSGAVEKIKMPAAGCGGAAVLYGHLYFAVGNSIYEIRDDGTTPAVHTAQEGLTICGMEVKDGAIFYDLGKGVLLSGYVRTESFVPEGLNGIANLPSKAMHRLYNGNTGEHLYTADENEKNVLTKRGWTYEGIAWYAPQGYGYPVYRMYNPASFAHHYTMDINERDTLCGLGNYAGRSRGWTYEGIGWYSPQSEKSMKSLGKDQQSLYTPLHRLYRPGYPMAAAHHYTADEHEVEVLLSWGWVYEGIAWYGN